MLVLLYLFTGSFGHESFPGVRVELRLSLHIPIVLGSSRRKDYGKIKRLLTFKRLSSFEEIV